MILDTIQRIAYAARGVFWPPMPLPAKLADMASLHQWLPLPALLRRGETLCGRQRKVHPRNVGHPSNSSAAPWEACGPGIGANGFQRLQRRRR